MRTWQDYLKSYRESLQFSPIQWVKSKCEKFNQYLKQHNLSGAVVSVSGGIDSALTLTLLHYTMCMPDSNLKKIMAINQPIHSSAWAYDRSKELCDFLGIQLTVIDQTDIHNMITERFPVEGNAYSKGQLRSYMRTPVNYYAAQLLSQQGYPAVVMGTGNKDEDGYLAYFCKYGDGAVDVQLISDLHKSQVFMVAKEFSVINSILKAKPSADLWEGHTDEEEMGVSYDFVEFLTGYYMSLSCDEQKEFADSLTKESHDEFVIFKSKCEEIHRKNSHKLNGVVNL